MIMAATIFDTLAYTEKLRAAGVPEAQAEAQATTFAEIIEDKIATKQDLKILEQDIKDLEGNLLRAVKESELRTDTKLAEMRTNIESIKADIIKWFIAISAAQTTLFASFTKFLH